MSGRIISIESKGSTKNIDGFFKRVKQRNFVQHLHYYGRKGVAALVLETPIDTAETAAAWDYHIEEDKGSIKLWWTNDHMAGTVPVVILIQYGHATGNGAYVEPRDFINPVTQALFNEIADTIWKEVTRG